MGPSRTFAPVLTALLVAVAGCKDPSSKSNPAKSASAAASASAAPVTLEGVDSSTMSTRERQLWSDLVSTQLAPCKDVAVPLSQCVAEKRACASCRPAAEFLARQVQAGLPKDDVIASYEARFLPDRVKAIVIGDSATRGPSDAPVTVVEFADFECPSCGSAYPLLEKLYEQFEGKVRFVFKNFPLPSHSYAKVAARAVVAAQKQGQFWRLHHTLFENQLRLTESDILGYAEKAGLDLGRFKTELHSDESKARVDAESKQGEELGVHATPTLFINGRLCDLSKLGNPAKELELWLRLELELAGVSADSPTTVASAAPETAPAPGTAPSSTARPTSSARP